MVVKLFCTRQNNLIKFVANGFLKRRFCNATVEQPHEYKYLLVLDFEATCERKKKVQQEIIEFPCLKVNSKTLVEESRFHHYVRPIYSPILSDFCVQLTGILQEMVDESLTFPDVYNLFEQWREKEGLTDENSLYITSGDWDLGHMIKAQCFLNNLDRPSHMLQWADLKKLFGNNEGFYVNSFNDILQYYGLVFEGRPHSGIDDCLNMLRVIRKMAEAGVEFKPTAKVNLLTSRVEILSPHTQPTQIKDTSAAPTVKISRDKNKGSSFGASNWLNNQNSPNQPNKNASRKCSAESLHG